MVEQAHRGRVLGSFLFLNLDGYNFFVVVILFFRVLYSLHILFHNNSKFLKYCALVIKYIFCTLRKKLLSTSPFYPVALFIAEVLRSIICTCLWFFHS